MGELYGSMHYIETHPERMRHTVAALCMDTPAASYDLPGTEYTFYMTPHVAKSYADALILQVAQEYFPKVGRPWHEHAYTPGTDTYLSDPMIGVPTVWGYSGSGVETHHNSQDTPDRVDPRSLRDIATTNAIFLYYLANAGEPEMRWLAKLGGERGDTRIQGIATIWLDRVNSASDAASLAQLQRDASEQITYTVGRETQAVLSVLRLLPVARRKSLAKNLTPLVEELNRQGKEQSSKLGQAVDGKARELGVPVLPVAAQDPREREAAKIIVRRKRFGTTTLVDLPPDQREGYPSGVWERGAITALFWCDGHRNLAEVIHLTRMELGPTNFDFLGYFRFLQKHGYVDFVRK